MNTKTVIAVVAMLMCGTALAEVRPISEAERAAVQYAAEYFASGPQAIVTRLTASSPLRSAAEIEARLGPPAGAQWELVTVVEVVLPQRDPPP